MNSGNATGTPPPVPAKSNRPIVVIVGAACLVAVLIVVLVIVRRHAADAKQAAAGRGMPPVPILAGTVMEKDVPVYLDGLGTVQALNTVTVRVLVDGQLNKVAFTEGQDVKAGDVLAQVDPAPYAAALGQAKAKKGQDEAMLANANLDMKREVELFAAKVDSQQVYDTQKALVDQLVAAVKADQAAIDSAQVQLDRTTILSPLAGRTGIRLVDQGNMVHPTDSNGLVVITQLRPITAIVTLPEQTLVSIHKEMEVQKTSELTVLAMDQDNTNQLDIGKLAVIDNQIDTTTGTIKLKATFPNENLRLWPGQWINARLLLTVRSNSLVVPASTIQRGPDGAYVFVIQNGPGKTAGGGGKGKGKGKHADGATNNAPDLATKPAAAPSEIKSQSGKSGDGTNQEILSVVIQKVTVAPQIEAGQVLVESGLQAGQRVVVDGQYKLQDGSAVKITSKKVAAADAGSTTSMQ